MSAKSCVVATDNAGLRIEEDLATFGIGFDTKIWIHPIHLVSVNAASPDESTVAEVHRFLARDGAS